MYITLTHIFIHTYIHTYTYIHIDMHTYIDIDIDIYIYTHTMCNQLKEDLNKFKTSCEKNIYF